MTVPPPPPPSPASSSATATPPAVAYYSPRSYVPTADDRTMSMLIHLSLLFFWPLALILWLMKKEQSPFIDHHGKQALSMLIAKVVATLISAALIFVFVGCILLPLVVIADIILVVMAALAANRGEWYVYPYVGGIIK